MAFTIMSDKRRILITGSSRGIGAAIARLAHTRGYDVLLHGRTDSSELTALRSELDVKHVIFDVTDERAVQAALANRAVDVLVNCAGINLSKTFAELSSEEWRAMFETNLFGMVAVVKAVIPAMRERKTGSIVNIASIKGLFTTPAKPAYAASKAAVIRMTSSMAEEFAPLGIRVNAVAPGFTNTGMLHTTLSPTIQKQIDRIPLRRPGEPSEIAEAVLFLAGDASSYITGQTLVVDGGFSIA